MAGGIGSTNSTTSVSPSSEALFTLLRAHPITTRTELVRRSGLSKATVSDAIAALMALGLLKETGKLQPGRGRSQVVLEFQAQTRLVLGAHYTEHACRVVLADLLASPVAQAERPLRSTDPDAFVEAVVECVNELIPRADAPIVGLGAGTPGLIDATRHEVVISVPQQWFHVPLGAMLEERLGLPVVMANRAKAAALGEYWQGRQGQQTTSTATSRHPSSLFYAYLGSGIVSGLVNDGSLYLGSGGAAGELGHLTVLPDGPLCGCGNRGCLYTLASESAILRQVKAKAREAGMLDPRTDTLAASLPMLDIAMVVEEAKRGNPIVLEVLTDVASWLGIALAGVINLMNPSHVVIGGPITAIGAPFMDALREEIRRRALWDSLQGVSIEASSLGDDAGPIGAAALYLDLANPADLMMGRVPSSS